MKVAFVRTGLQSPSGQRIGRVWRDCLSTWHDTSGSGVGIGIGIDFYERHTIQELIFFDPDTDPDPDTDVHGASVATHKFD